MKTAKNIPKRRAARLARYGILDSPREPGFDEITILASTLCDAPFASVSFLDLKRQWCKSVVGMAISEINIEHSFCAHTVENDAPLIIADTREDRRFSQNHMVLSAPFVRFYAGFPLRAWDGTILGSLCVSDVEARPAGLSESQMSVMLLLAKQVEAQLEWRRAVRERDEQVEKLEQVTRDLHFAAGHDALTGLPNRALFAEILDEEIKRAKQTGLGLALLFIDVDHFKQVNDSLGHDAGDALLRNFATRLKNGIRKADTAARIGGDEFAVLLVGGWSSDRSLDRVLVQLNEHLCEPVRHRGRLIACGASIGAAFYPDDASGPDTLTKCSDLALAEAKVIRGTVVTYSKKMEVEFNGRVKAAAKARSAFAAQQLLPFYQPKIHLNRGTVEGFEALMRRQHGGKLVTAPDIFISEFPDHRLAAEIGISLLHRIFDDLETWLAGGIQFGRIAINSCTSDFAADNFGETLLKELKRRGLPPSLIELEVTEGVIMGRGARHVERALNLLNHAGVRIALDDFGTGYASLSHLKMFPVDVLKIDRAFVAGIHCRPDDRAIVRAVIGLGRNLGIETVAEGVETLAQAAFLRTHGCDVGQGYLYGAAIPAGEVGSATRAFVAKKSCMDAPLKNLGAEHPSFGAHKLDCEGSVGPIAAVSKLNPRIHWPTRKAVNS